jgi:aspartate beta-hydroxylase
MSNLFTRAQLAASQGRASEALKLSLRVLEMAPDHAGAALLAAGAASGQRDFATAIEVLEQAFSHHPHDPEVGMQLALAFAAQGDLIRAAEPLEKVLEHDQSHEVSWLYLSLIRHRAGQEDAAIQAAFQAVTRAQRRGRWLDEMSTPPDLIGSVLECVDRLRLGRGRLLKQILQELQQIYGTQELARIERGLLGYLKESQVVASPQPGQSPLFFYFPDLPPGPYHDPKLQPWSKRLMSGFQAMREEAIRVAGTSTSALEDFLPAPDGKAQPRHLEGAALNPQWKAFFFFRHGKRYAENHARCPNTSALLDSLDLYQIEGEAPEICFSILRPHTTIKAHHGITNTRLVMHLPLVVPADCALNIPSYGAHTWREGEAVMFDDTFLHEAWNRSNHSRIILLMDCWNPHLTGVERMACTRMFELLSKLHVRQSEAA